MCQSSTGACPALVWPGCFKTSRRAVRPAPSVVCAVTRHAATTSIFGSSALAVEAAPSPGRASQGFTVRFCGLHSSCYLDWSEGDHHAGLENTSLHATPRDSTDATNFRDVLEGQTQGSVCWASWWPGVTRASGRAGPRASPSSRGFPPREPRWPVSTRLQAVLTVPARNGRKWYRVGAVASFPRVGAGFLNSCLVSLLAVGWLRGIRSNSSNELFHTRSASPRGLLTGLPLSALPASVPRHQQRQSGRHAQLGGARNHVCDEGSVRAHRCR